MLNIELRDRGTDLKFDIESEFLKCSTPDTPLNRQLIKEIEQGEYIDGLSFRDRFGDKLGIEYLSTGCKAALLVANTNQHVDLQECGDNAVSVIIRRCTQGNIVMIDRGVTIEYLGDPRDVNIDVGIDGYNIRDLRTLNEYLRYMVDLDDKEYNAIKL